MNGYKLQLKNVSKIDERTTLCEPRATTFDLGDT